MKVLVYKGNTKRHPKGAKEGGRGIGGRFAALTNEQRGIDYDLESAFNNNMGSFTEAGITLDDIERIVAVVEGRRDDAPWHWIAKLYPAEEGVERNGNYAYIEGWCDYTGWDCRSGVNVDLHKDFKALKNSLKATATDGSISKILLEQLSRKNKAQTWDEKKVLETYPKVSVQ